MEPFELTANVDFMKSCNADANVEISIDPSDDKADDGHSPFFLHIDLEEFIGITICLDDVLCRLPKEYIANFLKGERK